MFMQLPWDMVCSDKYTVNHPRKSDLEHPKGRDCMLPLQLMTHDIKLQNQFNIINLRQKGVGVS